MTDKNKACIQSVYEKLQEVLALYEKTDCYNTVPAGEKTQDISEYMGNKLLDIKREIHALFMTDKNKACIQSVYEKLQEVLALYEETDCYNTVPAGEKTQDISEYMGNKLLDIKREIHALSYSEYSRVKIIARLMRIVNETAHFVRRYEIPGVVKRWQEINPKILFFDCAFDLMENSPEIYQKICSGSNGLKLACYPDKEMEDARKKYFQDAKKKYGGEDISDIEDKAFQDELLRTLALVFKNDFGDEIEISMI